MKQQQRTIPHLTCHLLEELRTGSRPSSPSKVSPSSAASLADGKKKKSSSKVEEEKRWSYKDRPISRISRLSRSPITRRSRSRSASPTRSRSRSRNRSRSRSYSLSISPDIVQSLNSPFRAPCMGAEPWRAGRESRMTCMRMLRNPPFFPPKLGEKPYMAARAYGERALKRAGTSGKALMQGPGY